jgi:hypothetical protein
MNTNAKTIAFDNAADLWKTRYSFAPTNYSYIDKKLITGRQNQGDNELFWLHDQRSRPMNNFYNTQYKSSLKASFNDNAHNNKLYKSLSLEGTGNLRGGQSRFLANNSSQRSQARDAHIGKLRERGGILYAPLGRNKYISGRNVKIAGVITGIEPLFGADYETGDTKYGWGIDGITKYHLKVDFVPGFSLESHAFKVLFGNEGSSTTPPQQIMGSSEDGNNETWEALSSPLISVSPASTDLSGAPGISGSLAADTLEQNHPEDRNQFLLKSATSLGMSKTPEGLIVSLNPDAIPDGFEQLTIDSINSDAQNGVYLFAYVVTPGFVSGSDPKGQYADIDLQLGKHGYEDFELDVLNLNYEPTGLDHSK